jgi:hypothetical protein
MADPLQTVKEMAAASEQGQTPAMLEQLLRETFPKRPGGWLWRWLTGPCKYDVSKVEPFEDAGFFRASCVFWVFARDHLLEGAVLPYGGTYGLFSLSAAAE